MLALQRVSSLIVSLTEAGSALHNTELACLDQLVAALRNSPDTTLHKYSLQSCSSTQSISIFKSCLLHHTKTHADTDMIATNVLYL